MQNHTAECDKHQKWGTVHQGPSPENGVQFKVGCGFRRILLFVACWIAGVKLPDNPVCII